MIEILCCSLAMRFKGGFRFDNDEIPHARAISSVIYGILFYYITQDAQFSLINAVCWWIGNMFGIGDYLGNLKPVKELKSLGDNKFVVKILDFLFHLTNQPVNRERIQLFYGWGGCFIRGAMLGVLLALGSMSWILFISCLSFPFCYKIGFTLEEKYPNIFKRGTNFEGWAFGELLYGAMIGLAVSTLT